MTTTTAITMKCAICGEEIKGKSKKLGDGNTVCLDCYESSPMIVTCELCEKEVLATNGIKDDCMIHCKECFKKSVEEYNEFTPWETWKEWEAEEGKTAVFGDWLKRLNEELEEVRADASKIWMKYAEEMLRGWIEEARKAA
jgi:hypothetical protein